MHQEVRIAGMGGQGILVIGQMLAHATLLEGRNVVWFPAYGPETRGGTADCTVIMSTQEIGSPVSSSPHALIAMNQLMLDKFLPTVRREGVVLINSSLSSAPTSRKDCKVISVQANDIAAELGNVRVANMVMLGAYVQLVKPVLLDSIREAMTEALPKRNHGFIPINMTAIERGAALIN